MQWSPEELALKSLSEWWTDAGAPADQVISLKQKSPTSPKQQPIKTNVKSVTTPSEDAPRRLRVDQTLNAQRLAASAKTPAALKQAISDFKGGELGISARSTVVFDGNPDADIMVICGPPDKDEDKAGLPAVGMNGQLLDKMFSSIGFSRKSTLYIASIIPWYVPGNRVPDALEWAICRPFIHRQIELVSPKIIITIGKIASQILLNRQENIAKLRGQILEYEQEGLSQNIPCIPLQSPDYLLTRSAEKANAWLDMLAIEKLAHSLGISSKV